MADPDRGLSRRRFLGTAAGVAVGGVAAGGPLLTAGGAIAATTSPKTPDAALAALRAGNRRYRRNNWERVDYSPVGERRASAQAPFAAILTCADSRISPALVFDVERGNLFSAQVAGNSVDDSTAGSLEYAVAVLKVPLIMVLGHSDCGAVKAAMDVVAGKTSFPAAQFGSIGAVVDAIVPAIEQIPAQSRELQPCIVGNARAQAQALSTRGPIIPAAISAGSLKVVSAVYDIGSGNVHVG